MTYNETLDFITKKLPMFHNTGSTAYNGGLGNILKFDSFLNSPHTKFSSIHVAGTNGKGSVSHMLAAVLQCAGYKTGLFTSPHIIDFRERIKINGVSIPENEITEFINSNLNLINEIQPSFFETTVAIAFNYFAKEKIDIAIIETGLGGRLDATNIINPLISVITNIGYDHTDILGDTLEKIAQEKAGIIKQSIPVVIGESQESISHIFENIASENNSHLCFADSEYNIVSVQRNDFFQTFNVFSGETLKYCSIKIDLPGIYQEKNIITVIKTIEILENILSNPLTIHMYSGLADVKKITSLYGRWQVFEGLPKTICDTAHNISGINEVVKHIQILSFEKLHIITGFVKEKDISGILNCLPKDAYYYFTKPNIPRAADQTLIHSLAGSYNLKGKSFANIQEAYTAAVSNSGKNDIILITGSIFLVADFLKLRI